MAEGLPFDKKDLDKIILSLLVNVSAQQHVLFDLLSPQAGLSRDQLQAAIDEKTMSILDHLYTQYGMTPDILLPDKDES
jgi:hypothetical protein